MAAPKGNLFWMNRTRSGRAKDWTDVEEMQNAITKYLSDTHIKGLFPTVEGLARTLGFWDTDSLLNYQKEQGYEDFFGTIRQAKLYIQEYKVSNLISGNGSAAGLMFDLKNNHGYKDKSQVDFASTSVNVGLDVSAMTDEELQKRLALLRENDLSR